jgi:hypothetical protein
MAHTHIHTQTLSLPLFVSSVTLSLSAGSERLFTSYICTAVPSAKERASAEGTLLSASSPPAKGAADSTTSEEYAPTPVERLPLNALPSTVGELLAAIGCERHTHTMLSSGGCVRVCVRACVCVCVRVCAGMRDGSIEPYAG